MAGAESVKDAMPFFRLAAARIYSESQHRVAVRLDCICMAACDNVVAGILKAVCLQTSHCIRIQFSKSKVRGLCAWERRVHA